MKRLIGMILIVLLLGVSFKSLGESELVQATLFEKISASDYAFAAEHIRAEGALLMDADTGEVLFYKNDKKRLYPASTTKILTALIAIEQGNLKDVVTVGAEVNPEESEESSAGLKVGDKLALNDLIAALLLPSGNDAARAIAVYIARNDSNNPALSTKESIDYFANLMNKKAEELGASDSHFMNPHGLHHSNHYSTAHDLAIIAREAMQSAVFRKIAKTTSYSVHSGGKMTVALKSFLNRNQLLQKVSPNYFAGATGIKTGFTDQAGYCLISSATRDQINLIAVTLHSTEKDVWQDSKNLLDYGFRMSL
jgi:D-alanyl-D-alanine carboxypeptidase (penicillin-binding protein 5/6)